MRLLAINYGVVLLTVFVRWNGCICYFGNRETYRKVEIMKVLKSYTLYLDSALVNIFLFLLCLHTHTHTHPTTHSLSHLNMNFFKIRVVLIIPMKFDINSIILSVVHSVFPHFPKTVFYSWISKKFPSPIHYSARVSVLSLLC